MESFVSKRQNLNVSFTFGLRLVGHGKQGNQKSFPSQKNVEYV